jgi:excisionase family DNA binding protein
MKRARTSTTSTPTRPGPDMTVRELAARYGVARSTIWRWVARGLVEVSRISGRTGVRVRLRR